MAIVIKKASGGIAVMRLIGNVNALTCIEQWKAVNPGEYLSHREMPDSAIPVDRKKRGAWDDSTAGLAIEVNLSRLKDALIRRAYEVAQEKYRVAAGAYSEYEAAYWPTYRAEALAYQAKGETATDADAPTLAGIAADAGITTAQQVADVMARATAFDPVNRAISARRKVLLAAISGAQTPEALDAVEAGINSGWPV